MAKVEGKEGKKEEVVTKSTEEAETKSTEEGKGAKWLGEKLEEQESGV